VVTSLSQSPNDPSLSNSCLPSPEMGAITTGLETNRDGTMRGNCWVDDAQKPANTAPVSSVSSRRTAVTGGYSGFSYKSREEQLRQSPNALMVLRSPVNVVK